MRGKHRATGKCRAMAAKEVDSIQGQQGPWGEQGDCHIPGFPGEEKEQLKCGQ